MKKPWIHVFWGILALAAPSTLFLSSEGKSADSQKRITAVFLGDSLTAGYGVLPDQAYPALLQKRLNDDPELSKKSIIVKVINSGVSGDTTSDGLNRLEWVLMAKPHVVFIALGANDMMRGVSPQKAQTQLRRIIRTCQNRKIRTALIGMKAFPNLGKKFAKNFETLFPQLATETQSAFFPFLLEGVAGDTSLNLSDGIHPNVAGQIRITDSIYGFVKSEILATAKP